MHAMKFPSPDLNRRRQIALDAWGNPQIPVIIGAGNPISIPGGLDQCYPFRAHPDYRWLTERHRPGGVLVFDPAKGWTRYDVHPTVHERLWEGTADNNLGEPIEQFKAWLEARGDAPAVMLGVAVDGVASEIEQNEDFRMALWEARRPKDEAELVRLRAAAKATAAGHQAAREWCKAGVSERRIQVEMEAAFFRAGGDDVGYGSIVGSGPNSAALHGHPTHREVRPGEVILIDAGAAVDGYVSDVTRSYAADGKPTPELRDLHAIVLKSFHAAAAKCRAGVPWHEAHLASAQVIAEGLCDLKMITTSADAAVESGAVSVFFPHGVGHLVGLGVRDAGGPTQRDAEIKTYAGTRIRVDLPLRENIVMTVEPGCYFHEAMLTFSDFREKYADHIDFDRAMTWIPVGGVRLEDNFRITSGEPENLTGFIPMDL